MIPANAFKIPDNISDDRPPSLTVRQRAYADALFRLVGEDVLVSGAGPIRDYGRSGGEARGCA